MLEPARGFRFDILECQQNHMFMEGVDVAIDSLGELLVRLLPCFSHHPMLPGLLPYIASWTFVGVHNLLFLTKTR